MFQVAVLGPIEVRRDGQLVRVPGGKASELLVRLTVEAGELVRTDRLVDDLWAAAAVNTRRNTLQSKIARLRRSLGASVITSGDGGYTLAVEPSEVDALAVLRHTSPRPVCSMPATSAAPTTCVRRHCGCIAGRYCKQPATASGSPRTGLASSRHG